jgi:ATP-dependent Lon protease
VKDLVDIPDEIKNRLEIHPVRWIEQVLEAALERQPTPLAEAESGEAAVPAPQQPTDEKPVVIKH